MTGYRRILVRTPNWVGDAVMALPFLASLRLHAPRAEIHVLTRPSLLDFYTQVPSCNRVIALDESRGRHGFRSVWHNARILRSQRYDLAFCLPPSFGSTLMMRLAGIPRRIGHGSDRRGWLLTDCLPYLPNGMRPHRAESFLSLLGLIWNHPDIDRTLHYDPGPEASSLAWDIWSAHAIPESAPVLGIAPGAAQPNKLWAEEGFAAVCRQWLGRTENAHVVIVGGLGDARVCDGVLRQTSSDRIHNLCGAGSLPLVAAILRRADVFVGNDSGLAHLAAAVGTPVVVISGPGDPSEVAPFVENAITVKKPLFCSPCYRNTCYRTDVPLECQSLVTVDDVWEATEVQSMKAQARANTS